MSHEEYQSMYAKFYFRIADMASLKEGSINGNRSHFKLSAGSASQNGSSGSLRQILQERVHG